MLILLILLLVVTANGAGFPSTVNNEEFFNKTEVQIVERIRDMGNEALETFHLTPEAKEVLEEFERMPPMKLDHINPKGDYIDEINRKAKIDGKLFQGDIYLDEVQGEIIIKELEGELEGTNRTKRQAIRDKDGVKLWKDRTVNYIFNVSLNEDGRGAFRRGVDAWTKNTCIKFNHFYQLERYNVELLKQYVEQYGLDLLIVQAKGGCWSSLGRTGGLQQISLADACETTSIAAHELGHTLGFYHTMSRHDRDLYVIVNMANIHEYWRSQFSWQTEETNDNFDLGYDYGSIMHYRASDAAINRDQPTLLPYDKDYRATLGSPFVSFIDTLMLNKLYGCDKLCEGRGTGCNNGGYPHPLHCNKCVCPEGYAGTHCNRRPKGSPNECGRTYKASTEWQSFRDFLGDYKSHGNYTKCYYWIESEVNTEIEVELASFSREHALEGCPNAGVEIKTNENQQLTGYRFCSPSAAGTILRSFSNRVPIITYNRAYISETIVRYRQVRKDKPRPVIEKPRYRETRPLPTETIVEEPQPAVEERKKCEDHFQCPEHVATGFCTSDGVTHEERKRFCPVSCHLCHEL